MNSTSRHRSSIVVRCGLAVAQVLLLLSVMPLVPTTPALAATNQVTGVVFEDFNSNGVQDSGVTLSNAGSGSVGVAVDVGVGGVTVTAFDATGAVAATTTSVAPSGAYTLPVPAGVTFRIEFSGLPVGYVPARHGANNGTSVQFSDGSTPVNFGILLPGNYCQNNPEVFVNCFHFGASNSGNANQPSLYSFPYNAGSNGATIPPYDLPAPTPRTTFTQTGATWGLAWARTTQRIYTSAYFKKHTGFGPGVDGALNTTDDPGTIYVIDPATNAVVNKLLVPNATTNAHDVNDYFNDTLLTGNAAWDAVGKTSLGGIALSPDESRLFVMNLENRTLYALNASTGAAIASAPVPTADVPLPSGTCAPGDVRPFAVEVYNNTGYIGMVCSAESTQTVSNLRAYVYTFDLTTLAFSSAPVFQAALNYPRGIGNTDPNLPAPVPVESALWNPWSPTFRANPSDPGAGLFFSPVYPQPMLTSLAFDAGGNMVLGLRDRFGDQMGNEVPSNPAFPNALVVGVVVGDQLRACGTPATGWTLEDNARCGGLGTSPQNDGQGPGGGEYYSSDEYNPFHDEVSMGTVNQIPGYPDVMAVTINPININGTPETTNDGGIRWFNNSTGGFTKAYRVYNGQRASGNLFGKAAGLGDLTVLCDEAPIELGNRVWNDTNSNGRQDPGEPVIDGVTVGLYDAVGNLLNTTTTAVDGTYYFTATNPEGTARILPNTAYSIRIDITQLALTSLSLTTPNSAAGGNGVPDTSNNAIADVRDSDAILTGTFAVIAYTTGGTGATNHGLDFGFTASLPPPPPLVAALGDYVWVDVNRNGIQDEPPSDGFNGLTVSLLQNGSVISTTTTANKDGSPGYYLFDNLQPGSYTVCFDMPPAGYAITLPNQGADDALDSDADVTTGCAVTTTLAAGETNLTIDMGLQLLSEVAGLGDFVWVDTNKDGLQDTGEPGVPGVTVTLRNEAGTVIDTMLTNASGYYSFTELVPATYSVCFTPPQGYTFTLPNVGSNDAIDSDANPATGCTQQVTLAAGEFNPTLDAGLITTEVLARLGDRVWNDFNRNGIQDAGEPNVPGVTVTLRSSAGAVLSTTLTNNNPSGGNYLFDNLQPGSYIVCFALPPGYSFSPPNQGGNDAIDSDADMLTGCASTVSLQPGETNLTVDAGIYAPLAIAQSLASVCITGTTNSVITLTTQITNTSGAPATNIQIINNIPVSMTYRAGSSVPPATVGPNDLSWLIPSLPNNQAVTVQFTLLAENNGQTSFTSIVTASTQEVPSAQTLQVALPRNVCTTAINLSSFTAALQNGGGVKIEWKTALEFNTFGFYILRSATNNRADAVKVSDTMVTANGANSSYSITDRSGAVNSRYWLQEIELDGTQNEHGPIQVTSVVVQPQPGTQLQPQPQPVANPVGGAVVVGGGVPVSSLQSPVTQSQGAQQSQPMQAAAQQPGQQQSQQQAAMQAPAQAAQQPAQQQPAVASPLNTTHAAVQPAAQTAAQPAQVQSAQVAAQQQPAQPVQAQPVAVAEVLPAQQAAMYAAQPAQNVPAVGAQAAVGVVRGGAPADVPALTTTAQPASAPANPWVPIATALTLLGLGAAGAFVAYRRRTQR